MSQKSHCVKLNEQERRELEKIVRTGKDKTRKITRSRILLLADASNGKTDQEISKALNVCLATIFNALYSIETLQLISIVIPELCAHFPRITQFCFPPGKIPSQ